MNSTISTLAVTMVPTVQHSSEDSRFTYTVSKGLAGPQVQDITPSPDLGS